MMDAATGHNTIALISKFYGELLAEQDRQIQFLKSQNEALQKHIQELQSKANGDHHVGTQVQRMASAERSG